MADFSIHIEDHSADILKELETRISAGLEACGQQGVSNAESIINAGIPRHADSWYVPKGAAGLAGSINHEVSDGEKTVYVGTNNEHALYNEVGTGIYADNGQGRKSPWAYRGEDGQWHWTRGITPLHFLKKALSENVDEYKRILEQELSK